MSHGGKAPPYCIPPVNFSALAEVLATVTVTVPPSANVLAATLYVPPVSAKGGAVKVCHLSNNHCRVTACWERMVAARDATADPSLPSRSRV